MGKIVADCGCLQRHPNQAQRPRISPHQTPWVGHTATTDIWYPIPKTGHIRPYLALVGRFSRFAISGPLADHSPKAAAGFISDRRMAVFKRPVRLLSDKGSGVASAHFSPFTQAWGVAHICHPAECAYQGGTLERTIGVQKSAITAKRNHDSLASWSESVTLARVAETCHRCWDRAFRH